MKKVLPPKAFLLLLMSIILVSCDKEKNNVREQLSGTWNIINFSTTDPEGPEDVIGYYYFNTCSKKENRKAVCDVTISHTVFTETKVDHLDKNVKYSVLSGGNKVVIDESAADIALSGNSMILTFNRTVGKTIYVLTKG